MNNYKAYRQREIEREDLISKLNQQNRETARNTHEFEGWADRIMRSLLSPLGNEANHYWNPQRNKNGQAHYKAEK